MTGLNGTIESIGADFPDTAAYGVNEVMTLRADGEKILEEILEFGRSVSDLFIDDEVRDKLSPRLMLHYMGPHINILYALSDVAAACRDEDSTLLEDARVRLESIIRALGVKPAALDVADSIALLDTQNADRAHHIFLLNARELNTLRELEQKTIPDFMPEPERSSDHELSNYQFGPFYDETIDDEALEEVENDNGAKFGDTEVQIDRQGISGRLGGLMGFLRNTNRSKPVGNFSIGSLQQNDGEIERPVKVKNLSFGAESLVLRYGSTPVVKQGLSTTTFYPDVRTIRPGTAQEITNDTPEEVIEDDVDTETCYIVQPSITSENLDRIGRSALIFLEASEPELAEDLRAISAAIEEGKSRGGGMSQVHLVRLAINHLVRQHRELNNDGRIGGEDDE